MNVLGIKLTHDGAVALISDGELKFSVEAEKLDNAPRYSEMTLAQVEQVLVTEGIDIGTIDKVVIDGWKHGMIKRPEMDVAPYHEFDGAGRPLFHCYRGPTLTLLGRKFETESYTHIAGHLASGYAMSGLHEPCFALVFDGGVNPRLYYGRDQDFELVQPLTAFYGIIYGIMGYYFGPYKNDDVIAGRSDYRKEPLFGGYSTPGKLMAYIAHGTVSNALLRELMNAETYVFTGLGYNQDGANEHKLMKQAAAFCKQHGISDADALRTIHSFLGTLLIAGLRRYASRDKPLLFVGGSALNIKWNSAIRSAGVCKHLFVPPVPNDTGSAIGMAICGSRLSTLKWSTFAGPKVRESAPADGWSSGQCSTSDLAAEITQRPVVVLYDRAEIGPRALGHRSIMANPAVASNKDLLNRIKGREAWRPVAPICLAADAYQYFLPGTPDPYMLFDHDMKPAAREMFPAIMHIDGTARLQTVTERECQFVYELLDDLKWATGHGIVCNTSANLNGRGFFPDALSAMLWANDHEIDRVWCNGVLFKKGEQ